MRLSLIRSILILSFFAPLTVQANDTAFGGSGAAPMPISKNTVSMESEHIIISGSQLNNEEMQGAWRYDCNFVFKNYSDQTENFIMGFPLPLYDGDTDAAVPAGEKIKVGSPLVYNFEVSINGKQIPTKKYDVSANIQQKMNYKEAYIWNMTFAPFQTLNIHHNYITGVTTQVLGYNWVSYVVRTGGLWKNGTIGHTIIEVIPNTPTRLCSEVDKDSQSYTQATPAGMKIVGTGLNRKYVWDIKNFKPTEDVNLCLQTGRNYVRYHIVYSILTNSTNQPINLNTQSASQLRFLRNAIYAQYGRTFDDPKLQQMFNQQWWYVANPNYSDSMLTADDKKAIAMIETAESNLNTSQSH